MLRPPICGGGGGMVVCSTWSLAVSSPDSVPQNACDLAQLLDTALMFEDLLRICLNRILACLSLLAACHQHSMRALLDSVSLFLDLLSDVLSISFYIFLYLSISFYIFLYLSTASTLLATHSITGSTSWLNNDCKSLSKQPQSA